jgi:hypothetical protein
VDTQAGQGRQKQGEQNFYEIFTPRARIGKKNTSNGVCIREDKKTLFHDLVSK